MSPDKRYLAIVAVALLAFGCNAKTDASTETPTVAGGSGASSAAVAIATLTPEATLALATATATSTKTPEPSATSLPLTKTAVPATSTPTPTPTSTLAPTSTASPTPTPTPTVTPTPTQTPTPIVTSGIVLSPQEQQLFAAHNQIRASRGVTLFELHPVLMDVARERAQTMADSGVFSHYAPNGDTVFDLLNDAGYAFSDATENTHFNNVASGAVSFAMIEYQKSAPHLANIVDPGFLRVGIGFVTSNSGVHYVVVVFSD